jgi:hypothetical protein
MDEKDMLANAITKAIATQENGGKIDLDNSKAGGSGEMKSIFQFTPGNVFSRSIWKSTTVEQRQ